MEIDLELSSQENKLHNGSHTNFDLIDSMRGTVVEDEDVNINSRTELAKEACTPFGSGGATVCGEEVNVNTVGAETVNGGAIIEPKNGLEFESKEAAYSFYREYARTVGFGITIKASRRSKKSGKFIDVKIACSRFGSKRDSSTIINPRSCPKTGCKAGMHMKRREDEKWIIHNVIKEHNHDICPDDFYCAIRGRNKQSGPVVAKKGLQLALDEEDVDAMLEHFTRMQDENPGFFYAIDLDHENRMKNVFWIDAKARHDYNFFCDVVFFDTFYIRHNYKVPYAPFVGVNQHCQYILLGCTLIGEESMSTYNWLLQTWIKAVGDQAPKVIITDHDKFLSEVTTEVFPETRHCFSLWHILSKVPDNLSFSTDQYEIFMAKLNKCIYHSWTDEQFETRWWKMVNNFELKDNEWVQSLYDDRKKWVPTYMQDTFLAGMSTPERSGSVISFFDKYMHKQATFKEFVKLYMKFLQDRYDMEANADLETKNKQPALSSHSSFEKQMSMIYTDSIFKEFQVEVLGVVSCHLQKESQNDASIVFRVDDFSERQNFLVAWNEAQLNVRCSCRSFEYRGFLCKHAILVLQTSGAFNIPSHYILRRWTKDANIREHISEISGRLPHSAQRFNDLCKRAIKLGEVGSLSREAYNIAIHALEEALKQCIHVKTSAKSVFEGKTVAAHGSRCSEDENHRNRAPKSLKKKKTYKKRKVLCEPEGATKGLQDSCQEKEQMNSRGPTFDNCYVPQQDLQGMEIGSRIANLDGYYGSQQSVQGVLNSISPIRDGYYGNQPGIQVLGQSQSVPGRTSSYGPQQSMQGVLQLQGQLGYRVPAMHGCFDIHESLQDMEQSMDASQFHNIASNHIRDKH